jgi:hypothetical protein
MLKTTPKELKNYSHRHQQFGYQKVGVFSLEDNGDD